MPKLAGKIAWITGAGSGIGEAAALALAEEGATTVLTSRTRENLDRVAARIKQQGGEAHVQPANLMNSKQVQKIGDYIRTTFGRLDILVNNAGLNILDRHWDKLTPEGIDELVNGNLSQALYCVTVALPFMRAQKDGLLIHTASIAGRNAWWLLRTDLWRGEAWRGGDEPHDQHGGMRQRHPLHRVPAW